MTVGGTAAYDRITPTAATILATFIGS